MKKLLIVIGIALTLLATAVGSVSASTVYSNGGPGNTNGFNFENPSVADDFSLSSNIVVESIRFWAYSSSAAPMQTVGWAIMSGLNGMPSTVLFSGLSLADSITDTGNVMVDANGLPSNLRIFDVRFSIAPAALLGNSTYWLALDTDPIFTNIGNTLHSGWVFTNQVTGATSVSGGDAGGTQWSNHGLFADSAFELVGSPQAMPEPVTIALASVALLGIAATRRRRLAPTA